MGDGGAGGLRHHRLGMIGHAQTTVLAGLLNHRQIIGAVAHSQRLVQADVQFRRRLFQRLQFAFPPQDRHGNRAGQDGTIIQKRIAALGMKACRLGDAPGEIAEAARDQHSVGAMGAHGGNKAFRAGVQPHAFGIGAFQRLQLQALEQPDPLHQRGLEFDFAFHRPLGDGGDFGLEPRHVGEFIKTLDIDDGGVHVGDQQLFFFVLPPPSG